MANILYFSTRYPTPLRDAIIKDLRFSDSASAVVFSDAIFHGLVECGEDFINVNNPPVGYWPRMNKRLWIPTQQCEEQDRKVWNIGSLNIYVYQFFSIYWHTYRAIRKILKGESAVCVVYAINVPIIRAILRLPEAGVMDIIFACLAVVLLLTTENRFFLPKIVVFLIIFESITWTLFALYHNDRTYLPRVFFLLMAGIVLLLLIRSKSLYKFGFIKRKEVVFSAIILMGDYMQRPFHINDMHFFMLYLFCLLVTVKYEKRVRNLAQPLAITEYKTFNSCEK